MIGPEVWRASFKLESPDQADQMKTVMLSKSIYRDNVYPDREALGLSLMRVGVNPCIQRRLGAEIRLTRPVGLIPYKTPKFTGAKNS